MVGRERGEINRMPSKNQLPVFDGTAQPFHWDEPVLPRTLNVHRTLLRRAFLKRDLRIHIDNKDDEKWSAFSNEKLVKFYRSMPSTTSRQAIQIGHNKHLSKQYLEQHGVPTPRGITITASQQDIAVEWMREVGGCFVVKPLSGSFGEGVVMGIRTEEQLREAIKISGSNALVVEQFVPGADHRLFVIGGKLLAAVRRYPANVIGDGTSTVQKLIDSKNANRLKRPYLRDALIKIDETALILLKEQNISQDAIPAKGQKVLLQNVANVSRGGDSEDVTEIVHSDFHRLAEKCWRAFPDLTFAGIDLLAEDIAAPMADQSHAVIEININCDLALHMFPSIPSKSAPIDVADAVAQYTFPSSSIGERVSRCIRVKGKVQSVGFRRWLQSQARQLGVAGTVRNDEHGFVEASVLGTIAAIDELFVRCSVGPKDAVVSEISLSPCSSVHASVFSVES